MRNALLILALALIGCGAEAPSGPTQSDDAGATADGPSGSDASTACPSGMVRVTGGRCARYSDVDCDGVRCRAGTFCNIDVTDGTVSLLCE